VVSGKAKLRARTMPSASPAGAAYVVFARSEAVEYDEWERIVPVSLRKDRLWTNEAYRLSLYAAELGWTDITVLARDRRMRGLVDQLHRSVASVSANFAEGYSRSTGLDRARFYEYALGSARESRDWYFKTRHVLGQATVEARLELLTQVIRLLIVSILRVRGQRRITMRW
jgi:four helix bundle protein